MDTVLERGFGKLQEMRLLVREVGKKQQDTSVNVWVNKIKWLYKGEEGEQTAEGIALTKSGHSGAVGYGVSITIFGLR